MTDDQTPDKHQQKQHAPAPKPAKQDTKGITVKKNDDMAEWYGQVVLKSEVADYAPIRGFMIIRPRGYAFWQKVQDDLNRKIFKVGVRNAYFPLLIPESFFHKEATHAEGFSPEVAWIAQQPGEQERYAIRPTSETIMYDSYGRWIRSWRDLPLRMNQWCNIVRWEVQDTKIFLRTREFLWQEGHCVYETEKECHKETLKYLEFYRQVAEDLLAVPVLVGRKTERETFAGANRTYTIEGFMPDGKALQMGTSHDLGQGFAKVFGISFLGKDGTRQTPWQNSWGFSTRLLGALIMMHGDDKGLVLPPTIAENKVAIVPILFDATKESTLAKAREIAKSLKRYDPILDDREEYSAGWKFNEHELNGVPLRIEIGPKDIEKNQCVIVRRDTGEKLFVPIPELQNEVRRLLDAIQDNLFDRAKRFRDENIIVVKNWEEFTAADSAKRIMLAPHCGKSDCEQEIKDVTKGVTARCIPLRGEKPEAGVICVRCDQKAKYNAYWARAY
jgi:prolyl-tRNA synthetase